MCVICGCGNGETTVRKAGDDHDHDHALVHTHADGTTHAIPAAQERRIVDPTGCGDAYRAGLIFGLMRGMDWPTTGRVASLMGTLKIEHPGTQNQRFTYSEFADQFRQQFGYALG
jgi:adenosine kinase